MAQSLIESHDEKLVCVFCDTDGINEDHGTPYCPTCREYKGVMTVTHWEETTGEMWED